jgi:hypothetical protein
MKIEDGGLCGSSFCGAEADLATGTFEDPIIVNSGGEELQCGCTGSPADSHEVRWCVVSRDRPYERCDECGSGTSSAVPELGIR